MLRLNPTQIRLDKRDLDWHLPRHVERQARRAADPRCDITKETKRTTPKNQRKLGFPDSSPSPSVPLSSKYSDPRRRPDTEIFSSDPISHEDRVYWDAFFAQVGTPTALQNAPTARATVVDPSDDFLNSTHSARASIEMGSIPMDDGSDNEQSASFDAPSGIASASCSSNSANHRGTAAVRPEQRTPSEEVIETSYPRHRQSWMRYKTHQVQDGVRALLGHVNHSLSGSMAVDGPSDRHSSHNRNSSRSTSSDMGPDLDDGLYGSRRDRRTFSGAASREDRAGEHPESSAYKMPFRPVLLPPRAIGHSRNTSGNLPRSNLYISEAAASSSPERRPRTPPDYNPNAFETQGLLSLPPRRPRTYRPRSQTYSFAESEDSPGPAVPQMNGASTARAITSRVPSVRVSHPPNYTGTPPGGPLAKHQIMASPARTSNHYLQSSPSEVPADWGQSIHASPTSPYSTHSPSSLQEPMEVNGYRPNSSMYSVHSPLLSGNSPSNASHGSNNSNQQTLSQRNLSPYAAPFIPRIGQRTGSHQLILPPAFSATSRNVSVSSAYPPSSPASPYTSPHRQPSSSISPSSAQQSPSDRLPSASISPTAAPLSRRIPVYNDHLSPSTQPQTPAGLPRNGVPAMATQNPFNTAPVGGLYRNRAVDRWQAFATPTRRPNASGRNNRGSRRPEANQENEGQMTEQERGARRVRRETSWDVPPGEVEWGAPTP